MERLWFPQAAGELYYATRGEEVPPLRPIFQGDVFAGVSLPGQPDDDENLAMLVTHPCSMMEDQWYVDRMEAVRVRRTPSIAFDRWPREAFETLPMPSFESGGGYAAFFHERAAISTPRDLRHRVGALSLEGVVALQQRLVFELCRVVVGLTQLHEATRPLWDELELLEGWNERLINVDLTRSDDDLVDELFVLLERESKSFYDMLCKEEPASGTDIRYSMKWTLQDQLRNLDRRNAVRNAVQSEAKRRSLLRKKERS